jgi:ubiquinone/menaquinone biosynthesis C-methylase UbiE
MTAALAVANLRFVRDSTYRLPFADACFDAVYAHAVLYHLDDPATACGRWR